MSFSDPPDADPATDAIAEEAAAGSAVGVAASATDPDTGSTVTFSVDDDRFAIDGSGVITRTASGTLDAANEPSIMLTVTATSTDGSSATEGFSVSVTNGNSSGPPTSVTLVNTVDTSIWSPPSPDPSGIAFIPHLGTLLISDGEVNELSMFTGDNLFEMSLDGSLLNTHTAFHFSDEPTGVAHNPANRHLFFSDDAGSRGFYEVDPGPDTVYDTADDTISFIPTRTFGCADPEGLAYDTNRGVLYIAGGTDDTIYTVDPGSNGTFDGVASDGGDDTVTSFTATSLGISDPEGIEYDPELDLLYIIASSNAVAMVTPTGELVGTLDISAASARNPAGLALGPSSANAAETSLYVVDRGRDSNAGAPENDGEVYEFRLDHDDLLIA